MPSIFQIGDDGYWTGAVVEIAEDEGAPAGWTREALPDLAAGEHAVWDGAWTVTSAGPDRPTPAKAAMTAAIYARREAGLASGFDHDFGTPRGIHRIGTTAADMKGWDEVTKGAQAKVNVGEGSFAILILTDTGPVEITAQEWFQVLSAAFSQRQAIWQHSFTLLAQIAAATTQADLDAIDIADGWPA